MFKLLKRFRKAKNLISLCLIILIGTRCTEYFRESDEAMRQEIESRRQDAEIETTIPQTVPKEEVTTGSTAAQKAEVVSVIDGDTIKVITGGEKVSVRLIGVNTPESSAGVKSGYVDSEEAYGQEASDFTKSILKKGAVVWLVKDVSETDKYDRLLRIVWLSEPDPDQLDNIDLIRDNTLQGKLLTAGMAETMTIEPDISYSRIFTKLQSEAMQAEAGMWHFAETKGEK